MIGKPRINHQIRVPELRVLLEDGTNLGVLALTDALRKAEELGADLIEIAPNAVPPIGKIMEFGKWQYVENKKIKKAKSTARAGELKSLQVKIGTGEHDLELKAKQASKFLKEGNRVKIDLYLGGRAKYLDKAFLRTRLERVLLLITEEFKMVQEIHPGPKGLTVTIEKT